MNNFIKKNFLNLSYAVAGLLTAILAIILLTWTMKGKTLDSISYRQANLVIDDQIRTEYLVGQEFENEGYSLDIGDGKIIPASDCQANYDFTSAGEKSVEISYTSENIVYQSTMNVTTLYVRSIEIVKYPSLVTISSDNIALDDTFEMYAILSTAPKTESFGEVKKIDDGYRIQLNANQNSNAYSLSYQQEKSKENLYHLTIYCGNLSSSFSFYNAAGKSFIINSSSDVVEYTSVNEEDSTSFTLVVSNRSEQYQIDCTGKTTGFYIYKNANGQETVYDFAYEMKDSEEVFTSSTDVKETYNKNNDENYHVEIDGNEYVAASSAWQRAVVNGSIRKVDGHFIVIQSEARILPFTYVTDEETDVQEKSSPSLTLYVTDYELNPKLGTGSGYSKGVYIYTDEEGNSTKMRFDMTIVSWTYIPLSNAVSDVYSDVTIGWDYTYNPSAPADLQYDSYYLGDLYAEISIYKRGEGTITQKFCASQSLWLKAVAGI